MKLKLTFLVLSECADVVKNHKCDYCGATLSECADENKDHKCEYCGNTVSEHKWADATCKAPKTCEICGKTEGKVADHQYGDWETVKEATTKEEGEQKKTCKVCGDTVTEAALKSGFSDYSNYIQLFKKQFGMTPLQYKKNLS
jgi:AraC-like DNA-binding protein